MRINDVNRIGALSTTAVPVFRAHEGTRVFASRTGVEAVVAALVSVEQISVKSVSAERVVEQVSCLDVAKPVAGLWLKSLVAAGMVPALEQGSAGGVGREDRGYGELSQQRPAQDGSAGFQRTNGFAGGGVSTDSNISTKRTNLIDPRDFRTSSPPG